MKSIDEAANEWVEGRYWDGPAARIAIDRRCGVEDFKAGFAHAQAIWRRPEERPKSGSEIVYATTSDDGLPQVICTGVYRDENHVDGNSFALGIAMWCYLSEFLRQLPAWANSNGGK